MQLGSRYIKHRSASLGNRFNYLTTNGICASNTPLAVEHTKARREDVRERVAGSNAVPGSGLGIFPNF